MRTQSHTVPYQLARTSDTYNLVDSALPSSTAVRWAGAPARIRVCVLQSCSSLHDESTLMRPVLTMRVIRRGASKIQPLLAHSRCSYQPPRTLTPRLSRSAFSSPTPTSPMAARRAQVQINTSR